AIRELVWRSSSPLRRVNLIASLSPVILPTITGNPRSILEIGCGDGQTLTSLGLDGCQLVALDITFAALQMSQQRERALLICGRGEALPFRNSYFDAVISKVALPYMNIPVALREIHRIMKPGAQLFLTMHLFDMARQRIVNDLTALSFLDVAYQLYAILN